MMKLDNFVGMMTGHFDNKDQFKKMQAEGKTYPYAEHVNTVLFMPFLPLLANAP